MGMTALLFVSTDDVVHKCCRDWLEPLAMPRMKTGMDPRTGAPKEYPVWASKEWTEGERTRTITGSVDQLRQESREWREADLYQVPSEVALSRPFLIGLDHGRAIPLFKLDRRIADSLHEQFFDGEMPEGFSMFATSLD
jgi:hypothetical protein